MQFNFGPKLVIHDDVLLFAGGDRNMHAFNTKSGKELWSSAHARGGYQSPEDLLVAAVADCFVLSFRAIAAASKFEWNELTCSVTGTLDKVERAIQFTEVTVQAKLSVSADADQDRAQRLLEKAKQTCFVTNSLKVEPTLETEINVA